MTIIRKLMLAGCASLMLAGPVFAVGTLPQPADCTYVPGGPPMQITSVNQLNPMGANNLSVHPAPGVSTEIDILFTGDLVCAGRTVGKWTHVQYSRDGRGWSGWVADKYLGE